MKKILIILSIFFFLQNCGEEKRTEKGETIVIENLQLDQEKTKWKANIETTEGIEEMLKILSDFKETDKLKDYKKLGRKLKKVNKNILNKCSMKGEAHDNLHAFLMPVFRYLKILKTTKSIPEAKKTVFNFERHLKAYSDYFE